MMNRRTFLAGTGVLLIAPLVTEAQQAGQVQTIGVLLFPSTRPGWIRALITFEAIHRALRDLGYVDGQNAAILSRSASSVALLRDLAGDLLRQNASVLVAVGAEAVQAARETTRTTPIVMLSFADPVAMGFVATLGRPGGAVTGVSLMTADLGEKRLELLTEAIPRESRVIVLWNPADAAAASEWRRIQAAGQRLGVSLVPAEVCAPDDVEAAFTGARKARAAAAVVVLDPLTYAQGPRIVQLAAKNRLAAMYGSRAFVEAGGLMAYEPNNKEVANRVAGFVDKILKGANPADLPVEQPTTFELVINLRTAKALGLTIPPALLLRADQVIE